LKKKRYDVELNAANIENIIKLAIGFTNKSVYLKQSTVQIKAIRFLDNPL